MLSDTDTLLYTLLGILTIFLSSLVAITFLSSKDLRQHPSGLLASLSIAEIIMAYHSIIFANGSDSYIKTMSIEKIVVLYTVDNSDSITWLCGMNQILLSSATICCICYNIAICLDLVITLYNPLIPGGVRKKWYHALTLVALIYFTTYVNVYNRFIDQCRAQDGYSLEIMNTVSIAILLMIYLGISITSIIYSAYRFANGLKLESETTTKYLIRHCVYVNIYVICWVWPPISYLLKKYNHKENIDEINTTAIATTSCSGFFLGLIRISDPVVWKKIKQFIRNEKSEKIDSEDAWNQPISVFVQGKLNSELTHCMFESLHYAFETLKFRKSDRMVISEDYSKKETLKVTENMRSLSVWGVRDSKINGCVLDVYAPDVFIDIIKRNNVALEDIISSLDPLNNADTGVDQSAGKSGSFFLFTKDKRLSIKTIKRSERLIMKNFLPDYHRHLEGYEASFLCRIYGLFVLKIPGVAAIDILLMQNVFYEIKPIVVYDIKGSTAGRTSIKQGKPSGPLKDLDFMSRRERLHLNSDDIQFVEVQLLNDLKLLKKNKLMDYSMLISISDGSENSNTPSRSFRSVDGQHIYTLGIIDFLTEYGYLKSIERTFTTFRYGKEANTASVANPAKYANRFFNFFFSVIIPITRRSSSFVIRED